MKMYRLILVLAAALFCLLICSCEKKESRAEDGNETEQSTVKTSIHTDIRVPAASSLTVIIDPGHGFDDPGSCPKYLSGSEAEVTLRAANILKAKLEEAGIGVVLTHDGRRFPSVDEICAAADNYGIEYDREKMIDNNIFSPYERVIYENIMAAQFRNCIFISLHTNSYEDASVSGLSIDYHAENPNLEQLRDFSALFRDSVAIDLGKECTVFEDSYDEAFIVTKYTGIPSVLIEMGYGSNKQDGRDLMSDEWLYEFCTVLSKCIIIQYKEGAK